MYGSIGMDVRVFGWVYGYVKRGLGMEAYGEEKD